MRKRVAFCALLLVGLWVLATPAYAQQKKADKSKRPSPPATAQCKFADGNTITVDYSSPRMKDRKIYGGLVPWGQVWQVGANEATTFVLTTDVVVGNKDVPAGNYTIFAIPNPDQWTLIISRKTGIEGIPYPGENEDLTRTGMKVEKLPSPVENFTISFDQAGKTCTMRLDWETSRASVRISEVR
jgi:hypothetical protein